MTVEPWHYDTAEDLDKTIVERLRNFPASPICWSTPPGSRRQR